MAQMGENAHKKYIMPSARELLVNLGRISPWDGHVTSQLVVIIISHVKSHNLAERESIAHTMQSVLDEATDPWGVKVERVEMWELSIW